MEYVDGKEMTRCKTCDGTDFEYVDGKDPKCSAPESRSFDSARPPVA